MVDRITAGDQKGALEVLERLLDAGENPFRILPLIERQLRLPSGSEDPHHQF